MKTIPNPHTDPRHSHDRFHLTQESDLQPLAAITLAHTRIGIDRYETLAEIVLRCAARTEGFFPPGTDDPCRIDTVVASLARQSGYHFAGADADSLGDGNGSEPDAQVDHAELPEPALFPGLSPEMTFNQWAHEYVSSVDTPILGTLLGTSLSGTQHTMANAMTLIYGLPGFLADARAGLYTMEHIDTAAHLAATVAFADLSEVDRFLTRRRADVTVDTFYKALRKKIRLLADPVDRQKQTHAARRVEKNISPDGTGYLTLIGPAPSIEAAHRRVEAMARAIRLGNTDAFGLDAGDTIDDDRSIDALMYDIFTRPVPELSLTVTTTDPVTGLDENTIIPWTDDAADPNSPGGFYDSNGQLIPVGEDDEHIWTCTSRSEPDTIAGSPGSHAGTASSTTFSSGSAPGPSTFHLGADDPAGRIRSKKVSVRMPTDGWWFANQIKLVTTVPFITAFTEGSLPGSLPDGSPIPPDMARSLVGHCSTLTRVLTDPATGTPLDAKALSYRIPASVRTTLIAKFQTCTVPGCTRRADLGEIDHIEEFFHLNPAKGGPTTFMNLQCVCARHHGHKTARTLDVTMTGTGELEYSFRHGLTTTVGAPDDPVNMAQALSLHQLCEPTAPPPWVHPDADVSPTAITIKAGLYERSRRRLREWQEFRREVESLQSKIRHDLSVRRQRETRLRNCLDWEHAVFLNALPPAPVRLCLPPGDPEKAQARLDQAIADVTRRFKEANQQDGGPDRTRDTRCARGWEVQWDHDPDTDPPPF